MEQEELVRFIGGPLDLAMRRQVVKERFTVIVPADPLTLFDPDETRIPLDNRIRIEEHDYRLEVNDAGKELYLLYIWMGKKP